MKIQNSIGGIESAIKLDIGLREMSSWKQNFPKQNSDSSSEIVELTKTIEYFKSEDHIMRIETLSQHFKDLLEEIYVIHKMGIHLRYP
jgi:hypothetical protein